ncbi:hypothetical protein AL1_08530 [Alistipes shahii WAL 8301]|uniref:Uncharacterized protein n=1 Tax=Alistipes shahii WAL 8301 TaxID=717959 RepID=D4IKE2_9BACT|nr:hypothetical protein AL1_08530 [Alistipes shahii WAL 8301]
MTFFLSRAEHPPPDLSVLKNLRRDRETRFFGKILLCARSGPAAEIGHDQARPQRGATFEYGKVRRWLLRTPIPKRGMATKKGAIQKTPFVPCEARDTAVLMRKKYALRHPLPSEKCVTSHFPAILPTE